MCADFVQAVKNHFPEFQKKVKIHLLLHLTQSMIDLLTIQRGDINNYIHALNVMYTLLSMSCKDYYNYTTDVNHTTLLYGLETSLPIDLHAVEI